MIGADISIILPEVILAVSAMALLMLGTYGGGDKQAVLINWLVAGLLFVLGLWIMLDPSEGEAFNGAFIADGFAQYTKVLMLWSAAIILVLARDFLQKRELAEV